ncbi:MAG: glycosyltransferase [Candidatus Poribacteria bacterium]|nr:glycosyltransferase [Candidatus Poribacteria bacterium]
MIVNPFFTPPVDHKKLRFHVLSVPYNPSHEIFSADAFAQKSRKVCWMLKSTGHEVFHYGNELSIDKENPEKGVICDEHISVTTESELMDAYPNCKEERGYVEPFTTDKRRHFTKLNAFRTIQGLKNRVKYGDFICYIVPTLQRKIHDEVAMDLQSAYHIEISVGYFIAYLPYKIFESPAIRAAHYGYFSRNLYKYQKNLSDHQKKNYTFTGYTHLHYQNLPKMDAVIPYSFYRHEYDFRVKKDDYLLYLGRIIPRKGVAKAVEIAKRLGKKLVVAGPGDFERDFGKPSKHVELVGPVGIEARRELLSKASALIALPDYWEPFGAIQLEAMASGTPPIVPDNGAFPHYVRSGYNGFRLNMNQVEQGVWACKNLQKLDPYNLRDFALRFSNEQNALRYDAYFQDFERFVSANGPHFGITNIYSPNFGLENLYRDNLEIENPYRDNLDWLDLDRKIEWPEGWMQPVG